MSLAALLIFSSAGLAGTNQWTTTGPNGGDVTSLAVSPSFASDHILFAGTSGGGVFGNTLSGADTTPPTVTNVKPTGTISTTSATLSADYTDNAGGSGINSSSATLTVSGDTVGTCTKTTTSISCPVTGLSQRTHTISGSVSDNAGNTASTSGSFTVALARNYFWTWYDNVCMKNWVLLAKPGGAAVTCQIKIAGSVVSSGPLGPGQRITPTFPGKMGGPVAVSATGNVFASRRVLLQRLL